MAQKVQVILVDDLDGGEAEESVSFALDGVSYEIDLSAENAEQLRDTLAQWIGHARRVGGRSRAARGTAKAAKAARSTDLADVRAWARKNGWPNISDRGRVSAEVMEAYEAAN